MWSFSSQNRPYLPKTAKFFQNLINISKNRCLLPKTDLFYQKALDSKQDSRLKRIESQIARDAASKAQNTSKTQNTSTQSCSDLFWSSKKLWCDLIWFFKHVQTYFEVLKTLMWFDTILQTCLDLSETIKWWNTMQFDMILLTCLDLF